MRKIISGMLIIILLFGFSVSVTADDWMDVLQRYVMSHGEPNVNLDAESFGSVNYWKKQIEENQWQAENRPEPLMGDANIDGKVNAVDALFALHFAVDGNIQTYMVVSGTKTPPQMQWRDSYLSAYNRGTLSEWVNLKERWGTYCVYNSPFFADVTKDCVVNALDALEILKYSVGKATDFPEGDFTSVTVRFSYYPWPTEYYPDFFKTLDSDMTVEEFCEKYNFDLDAISTDE